MPKSPNYMLVTRILLPILSLLAAIAVVVAGALLPFVPSWKTFQTITLLLGVLGLLAATIWLVRGIWIHSQDRLQPAARIILTLATGFALAVVLFASAIVATFGISGGPFGETYHHSQVFPEYNVTAHVYDNSFLDPTVRIALQRGNWPLEEEVGSVGSVLPEDAYLELDGEYAVHEHFRIHLPTGTLEHTY